MRFTAMNKPLPKKFTAEDGCVFECDEFNQVSVFVPTEISSKIPTDQMERYLLDRIVEVADILGIEPDERTGEPRLKNSIA
jgi:hypothetical protein